MRNIIIGVDGADWQIINKLIKSGELPNFSTILTQSAYGASQSYIDYPSPALWTTIDTGKIPPKHGVTDFFTSTRDHVTSKRTFEIIEGNDGKLGLMKWYCTWPIIQNDGFTIPSWLTRKYEAYPPKYSFVTYLGKSTSLKHQLKIATSCLTSGVSPTTLLQSAKESIKRKISTPENLEKIATDNFLALKIQAEVYLHLLKKYRPNFSAFLISTIDSIGHRYWKYYEPELFEDITERDCKKYGKELFKAYKLVDHYIGKIVKLIDRQYGPDEVNISIVSDHGMQAIQEAEKDWGYHPRTLSLLELLDLKDDVTATNIGNHIYIRNKTKRFSNEQLFEKFANVTTSDGQKVFLIEIKEDGNLLALIINKSIRNGEQLHDGEGKQFSLDDFASPVDEVNGTHAEKGIFIFRSKHIKQNYKLDKKYGLECIAPTILHLNGKPIGKDMDGRPIQELFCDEFLSKNPVKYVDSYDEPGKTGLIKDMSESEEDALTERLKSLGYLS